MELIELAGRQLLRWGMGDGRWQDDANRKRRLAEKLCQLIAGRSSRGYPKNVKVNWITLHLGSIEQKRLELSRKVKS